MATSVSPLTAAVREDRDLHAAAPAFSAPLESSSTVPQTPAQPKIEGQPALQQRPTDSASRSPERPAVSPITPTASAVHGANMEQPPPLNISAVPHDSTHKFVQPPPSKPFSDEDSTDAAALRAAISILQIQKEKSKRDIQTLQKLKDAANQEPDEFLRELVDGKLRHEQGNVPDPLRATFEGDLPSDDDDEDTSAQATKFPKFPNKQNVFRCPPVNWAKYRVVGAPLDKMHEQQRKRPTPGEPLKTFTQQAPTRDHVISAPFDPWKDAMDPQHPMQTRKGSAKPP